jgi:hypothetical protein
MAEKLNFDELDLSAPGALEALMNLPDEPQETEDELPEDDSGKQNAAFARLRKERQAFKRAAKMLQEKTATLEAEKTKSATSQVGSPSPSSASAEVEQLNKYEQSVYQRAGQVLAMRGYTPDHPEYGTRFLTVVNQIMIQEAVSALKEDIKKEQAPAVTSAEFDAAVKKYSLDISDQSELRKRLSALDPIVQADQAAVRKEIAAYIGENFERFSKLKPPPKGGETEEEQPEGWRIGETQMESATAKAGAAAGSQIRANARGVKVPEAQASGEGGTESVPRLGKEDRELMRKAFDPPLDPSNALHVKRYLAAKRKKEARFK